MFTVIPATGTLYFTCFTNASFLLTEVWRARNSPEFTLSQAASGEIREDELTATNSYLSVATIRGELRHFDCAVVEWGDGCAGGYGVGAGADGPRLSRQNRWKL